MVFVEFCGYIGGLIVRLMLVGISYDIGVEGWVVCLLDIVELVIELGLMVEKLIIVLFWVYFDDVCFVMFDNVIFGILVNLLDLVVIIVLGVEEVVCVVEFDCVFMFEDFFCDLGMFVVFWMGLEVLWCFVILIVGGIYVVDLYLLLVDVVFFGLRVVV